MVIFERIVTWKNSFQKVCLSALSLVVPFHSRENLMALWRISFQEIGTAGYLHGKSPRGNAEFLGGRRRSRKSVSH